MAQGATKPKIAILEDHDDTRELLRISLADHFSCRDYGDANHLLGKLVEEQFSAVIADIMLPGVDGYTFIRAVRADPRLSNLCVIALTALAYEKDREKAIAEGFTDYLVKPASPDQIAAKVWHHIRVT